MIFLAHISTSFDVYLTNTNKKSDCQSLILQYL